MSDSDVSSLTRFGRKVLGDVGMRETDLFERGMACIHLQRRMTPDELAQVRWAALPEEMLRFRP